MEERGAVGRDVEMLKEMKTRRGAARKGVEGVAHDLKRVIGPGVLPGVVLMRMSGRIVHPGVDLTKRMTDLVALPDVGPTRRTNRIVLLDVGPIPSRKRTETNRTILLDAQNPRIDPAHHATPQSHLAPPLPTRLPQLFRQKWTSISRNRMTLSWMSSHCLSPQYLLPVSSVMQNLKGGTPCYS